MKVELASESTMDPLSLKLRQYLYNIPFRFECRHDNLVKIRRELRVFVLTLLAGEDSHILFGNEPVASRVFLPAKEWNPDFNKSNLHSHNGRPCARKLERGEPTHRCLTCGVDDTCVLCTYCFNPDDHINHNVFVKVSSRDDGGICDCGDAEAWNSEIHCKADGGEEETQPLPERLVERASTILNVLFDHVVDVLAMSSMDTQTTSDLDYLKELAQRSELIQECYGVREIKNMESKWCVCVWDDDRRSLNDLYATLQLATSRGDEYLEVVIDQVQLAGRATVALSSSLEEMVALKKRIRNFNTSVRLVRDIIREEVALEIVKIAIELCHTHPIGYEPSAFMNIVGKALLNPWNAGVRPWDPSKDTRAGMDADQNNAEVYSKSNLQNYNIPAYENASEIPQLTFSSSGMDFDGENDEDESRSREELFGPKNIMGELSVSLANTLRQFMGPVRFSWPLEDENSKVKYLIFFDIRLPKMMRQEITDMYLASLVSNVNLKMQMATIYADVYPLLIDQYCKIDRDPECSVTTSLSTQLFTSPSIATRLMQSDAFGVYMNLICNQYLKNDHLNTAAFKNRRLGQIFHEFRNLLGRCSDKNLIGGNPIRIIQTAYFLSMFQGLAPLVRQLDKHVEYENEKWIFCFAIMPYIVQLCNGVASGVELSFQNDSNGVRNGIKVIARSLYLWQINLFNRLQSKAQKLQRFRPIPPPKPILTFDTGMPLTWSASKIEIWNDPVSMLNPVHWFLSFLIQYSQIDDRQELLDLLEVRTNDSSLFDANMCTLALLSHISVGYWVRNGLSLRIQLQCYRDTTLRDLAYAQDIHMVQVALSILNPSVVFSNLTYHFGLLEWDVFSLGDQQQTLYTINEYLQCLTLLLCDRLKFQKMDQDARSREVLRKEIIHMLGFEVMQYSELVKLIPESLAVDEHFDTVLTEVADFHPPNNENSSGKYSLKPEYYSMFDPYFTHFTISQTEEAVKAAHSKLGETHLPKLPVLNGTWSRLGMFTRCITFASFVTKIVQHVVSNTRGLDTLERVVHILLISALDDVKAHRKWYGSDAPSYLSEGEKEQRRLDFLKSNIYHTEDTCFRSLAMMVIKLQRDADSATGYRPITLVGLLIEAAKNSYFAQARPRIRLLFDLMREVEPQTPAFDFDALEKTNNVADSKAKLKEHAKLMQQKIMADFARQQEEFMKNNKEAAIDGDDLMADGDDLDDDLDDEDNDEGTVSGYSFPRQCVFCRMPDNEGSVFGVLSYTSKVDMLRNLPLDDPYWIKQAYSEDPSLDIPHPSCEPLPDLGLDHYKEENDCHADHQPNVPWGYSFPKSDIRETTLVQGCGHGLHYKCYESVKKQNSHQRSTLPLSASQDENEIFCPLCRGLSNCFIPVLWSKNTLEVSEFLKEPSDPVREMSCATVLSHQQQPPPISSSLSSPASSINDSPIESVITDEVIESEIDRDTDDQNISKINSIVKDAYQFISPKYADVISKHETENAEHQELRTILFKQLTCIRQNTPHHQASGLRPICRAMACCVVHIDVWLRGQSYNTPFGGILLSQLSGQHVQFLRVLGMYMRTLTGFILTQLNSCSGISAIEQFDDVNLLPNQSFTRVVEMIYFGAALKGISQNTVIRQMLVLEIGRVIILSRNMNTSQLSSVPKIEDPEVLRAVSSLTDMDPHMVYHFIRYHMTLTTRRLALTVFALCGKYDPDDYVGVMHLPEHDRLLDYLQMPNLDTIIKNIAQPHSAEWIAHQANLDRLQNLDRLSPDTATASQYTFIDYPGIYRLIRLPNRLDSMFSVNGFKLPIEPAVCLLCGYLCGIQENGFKDEGPCNAHMATCGVTQCIFLLPRRNMLLLLISSGCGTFIHAPYLDIHGEPDEAMRRGRPHFLQPKRYDAFVRDIWLRNGIPGLVMRKLDQSGDAGGWETL